MTSPPELPHRKQKTFFFFILITRLSESVDGLDTSLVQSPGELQDCKALQDFEAFAGLKGLRFFLPTLPFYQTRSPDLPQYTQWCSFLENTKLTNSYS